MGITRFVLKRPVTAILAILCLIVFGFQSITGMKIELSPDMDMSMLIVVTTYSGASPEDVNDLITKPIEDEVGTLSGLDSVTSTSSEGSSMVMLEYEYGTDIDEAYDDLKKKVDLVSADFPEDADDPVIIEMSSSSQPDVTLAVNNPTEDNLYDYVNNEIVPEFEKLSKAADVNINGGAEQYVKVSLIEEKMDQYGVTMSSIASDLASADLSYPAGNASVGSQELSVTTRMKYDTMELLLDVPLTTADNSTVYLADVAEVYTAEESNASTARFNGNDTILVSITKQQSATAMELSEQAKEVIDVLTRQNPDLSINIVSDTSENIMSSLMSVVETIALAIGISMVIIWLFLGDVKASLIVGSSIPVSILATLIGLSLMDYSLNVITLCALSLGVGMMVDNSIVVLESCFRVNAERKGGFVEYMKDALGGTELVYQSILGGTATTCVVFLPLAMLEGMTGQLFGPLGFTIVFCMVASLISAIAVVPLCYMLYRPKEKEKAPLSRPIVHLQDAYRGVMRVILPKKKTVMGVSILLLLVSFKLATYLDVELMSSDDNGEVSISVESRPGMKNEKVDEVLKQIEAIIVQHPDLESYQASTGGTGMMDDNSGSITAYLKDDREMDTDEVVSQWKKELADITDCNITVEASGSMSMMSSSVETYEVIIKGTDYDDLSEVANQIVSELSERPEVTRVHSDAENASPVIEVTVDAIRAQAEGLTAPGIGSTLNNMLSGIEATELEIDGEDISVMVEYPEGTYETLEQIQGIVLPTGNGGSVLLTDVADVGFKDSPAAIRREDKQYKITISADYTETATKESENTLLKEVVEPHLSETITTGLNSIDSAMIDEFQALFQALALAVFLIFVVMAAQFESPKFSIMVMCTIPFSLIGSFGLLWLTDCKISMVSLVGFLMLIGTVVNAGILYVETVNQYRDTMDRDTALIEAGATRLRPIMMTTLTTVLSMIPMAMAIGNSGEMTQGLAIVNIGGLTASTILSLLMLPVFYSIMSRTPKERKGHSNE